MAVEHTAETGHDITLATHLAKNFDSYGEGRSQAQALRVLGRT